VNLSFARLAALKDLRRLRQDPWKLVLWIGIPLLIGTLMTTVMGGSDGVQPKALLYLDDQDDSMISGLLVGAFSNEGLGELVEVERISRINAIAKLNQNKGSALIVIPKGFGQAVIEEQTTNLEFISNPAQRILPGILQEILTMLQQGVFYVHRVFGDELAIMRSDLPEGQFTLADPLVALTAVQINATMRSLQNYLNPLLIKLESAVDPAKETDQGQATAKADIPVSFYMLPSILLMAMFFLAQGLSEDYWLENDLGTLRRGISTPQTLPTLLLGKLLAAGTVFVAVGLALFTAGYWYHGFLSWSSLPLAVIWWSAGGLGVYLIMALVQLLASSRRGGSVMTNLIMFPLLMLGGSFFPFEAMPNWMAKIGAYTPNGWILEQLKPILLSKVDYSSLAVGFAGLLVATVLLAGLVQRRMRKVVLGS
jgi:ABC-type multidrug transport system permease subunit